MGREKWFFLLEHGDKKVFRIQRRIGKWAGYTLRFHGEVFETVEGRRVKTPLNWDFRREAEAIAWAMTDSTDVSSFRAEKRAA
jgi:hypothetical protein